MFLEFKWYLERFPKDHEFNGLLSQCSIPWRTAPAKGPSADLIRFANPLGDIPSHHQQRHIYRILMNSGHFILFRNWWAHVRYIQHSIKYWVRGKSRRRNSIESSGCWEFPFIYVFAPSPPPTPQIFNRNHIKSNLIYATYLSNFGENIKSFRKNCFYSI